MTALHPDRPTPPATDARTESPLAIARRALEVETAGLVALTDSIGETFETAVELLLSITGYCCVTGVGKSGHIARKIAATLSSTGTPAFFMHPTEMSHGDLGALRADGLLIAISNSGESRELRDTLHYCAREGIPIIGITRVPDSRLGRVARVVLQLPVAAEACPNGLAPTTSTTMTLALGDALAVTVMVMKGFGRADFGMRHPAGALGLQLQRVEDWMREASQDLPLVRLSTNLAGIIEGLTRGRQGCVGVVDDEGRLTGMITDGDLRRAFASGNLDRTAEAIMSRHPTTATQAMLMGEVIQLLIEKRIANIFVVDDMRPVAVIHIKDLMEAGYLL